MNEKQIMLSDQEVMQNVADKLNFAPDLHPQEITVKAHAGVVTLGGWAPSYREKRVAEHAAKRVVGVRDLVNDVQVRSPAADARPDAAIAHDAVAALEHALMDASDSIKVQVHQGRATLAGTLQWYYQRDAAETAVRAVRGVIVVNNLLSIDALLAANEA